MGVGSRNRCPCAQPTTTKPGQRLAVGWCRGGVQFQFLEGGGAAATAGRGGVYGGTLDVLMVMVVMTV